MLLVKIGNPLAKVPASSVKDVLALYSIRVCCEIVVAVPAILENVHWNLGRALQRSSRTPIPRNSSRFPRIKLAIDPDKPCSVDVAPAARALVHLVICAALLQAILETVGIGILTLASRRNVILPCPKLGQKACSVKAAP